MSVAAGVSKPNATEKEFNKGVISTAKVKRYWAGRAPEWAAEDQAPEDVAAKDLTAAPGRAALPPAEDRRLQRLAEARRDRAEAIAHHRQIRAAEIVESEEEEDGEIHAPAARGGRRHEQGSDDEDADRQGDEDDEEDIDERRARLRESLRQRAAEAEELEEEEEEEEESEYETDSEDEGGRALVKPVFVPKKERETVAERQALEREEEMRKEAERIRLEERKKDTRKLVAEKVRVEAEAEAAAGDEKFSDVDTDDDADEAAEYEAWKGREMTRIKLEREIREAAARERSESAKLSKMTDEERREYERQAAKAAPAPAKAPKKKWKFLQKYYHKGAFFQEAEDTLAPSRRKEADAIYRQDFSEATLEDKFDKSILPKVMQVRHFGRSGRSKWTHLVAEDTTQWDSPWASNDPLQLKYQRKMAGMDRPLEKPGRASGK
eukprot:jgi/Mesvir1/6404/Mv19499-RA.1